MKKIMLEVWGEPIGKGRPRFSRRGNSVRAYTPHRTAAYEQRVAQTYRELCGEWMFPEDIPLRLVVYANMRIPLSASKKRREAMLAGVERPTKKPDCDNILKAVADALNGVAYHDDKQIVEMQCVKSYSGVPSTIIYICEVTA